MKRADLLKHLSKHGCSLIREGGKHSVFFNAQTGKTSTVPRHKEVNTFTAQQVCKDLGIEKPKKK